MSYRINKTTSCVNTIKTRTFRATVSVNGEKVRVHPLAKNCLDELAEYASSNNFRARVTSQDAGSGKRKEYELTAHISTGRDERDESRRARETMEELSGRLTQMMRESGIKPEWNLWCK